MTITMKLSRFVALAGSIITLLQIFLLASDRQGICFNDGCRIVDSLTTVSPIVINFGGFVFFQTIFWGIWLAREYRDRLRYVKVILLAGLAAEGVLVSFQHLVAQTFCSYCLIILSLVVLLNVLAGIYQIFCGALIFSAVVTGFASLQFSGEQKSAIEHLDAGSFASIAGKGSEKNYLFFSSTCKYCEKVIESLKDGNSCSIRFNPIDEITDFSLTEAQRAENYRTDVNIQFLKSVGIEQIPVFLSVSQSGFNVIKGEAPIKRYLEENCSVEKVGPKAQSSNGISPAAGLDFLPNIQDDSCSVNTDCEDPLIPAPSQ